MKLCLASAAPKSYLKTEIKESKYNLESFFYFDEWENQIIEDSELFLLDSGAFTFMAGSGGKKINWERYIDEYSEFINAHKVDNFFELDIDKIVGYEKVKEFRTYIERKTEKQSMPVWHRSRGGEEFVNLCKEYPYIAIGGFAIKDIQPEELNCIKKLLNIALKYGTKVHGLGFTPNNVEDYAFYSVDSSSWTSGSRFASIYQFSNGKMRLVKKSDSRLINYKELDRHNLKQWLKFQKYLDR